MSIKVKSIIFPKDFDHIFLVPLGDTHVGDSAGLGGSSEEGHYATKKFRGMVKWIQETPEAYSFLVGDMFDSVTHNSPGIVFEQEYNLKSAKDFLTEELKPIKDKILGCVSEDTYCLSKNDGWKLIKNINIDEEILSFNPIKEEFEYQKVEHIYQYNYCGEVYHYNNTNLDFIVTPEHRIIYKPIWNLESNNRNKKFRHKRIFENYRVKTAKEFEKLSTKTMRNYNIPIASYYTGIDNNLLSNDELSLLGWIISEGTMPKDRNDIQIYQSKKHQNHINTICSLLKRLNIPYSIYNYKGKGKGDNHYGNQRDWVTIWINAKNSKKYRDILNSKKEIPRDILNNYSSEQLECLFQTLIDGDGNWESSKLCGKFYTSNLNLAKQVLELALKTNRRAFIYYRLRYGRFDEYSVNFSHFNHINLDTTNISSEKYDGNVYSLKVQNTFYLAMRNNKPFITGNSISGNHEERIEKLVGDNPVNDLAYRLGIDFFPNECAYLFLRVGESRTNNKDRRRPIVYTVFIHHMTGGGRTKGGKLNRLSCLKDMVLADVYLGGHVHLKGGFKGKYIYADYNNYKIRELQQTFVATGSYLGYADYAIKGEYDKPATGSPRIRLSGSPETGKDCHVSI